MRAVNKKITLVHRRLWPALVRVADQIPAERLVSITEEHTETGAHRKIETPLPDWVPTDVKRAAKQLSEVEAREALPDCLRPRSS